MVIEVKVLNSSMGFIFWNSSYFGAIIGARIAIDIDGDTFKRFLAIIMISVGLIIVFRSKSIASLRSS